MRSRLGGIVVIVVIAFGLVGCAATLRKPSGRGVGLDGATMSQLETAQALNRVVRDERTLARLQQARSCRGHESAASRDAALKEARQLLKQVEETPPAQRGRFEQRAGELLRRLQAD